MGIFKNVLIILDIVVCFALIVVAMMQSKDDSGTSGTITASRTSNVYEKNKGRTKEGKLKRLTIVLAIAFAVLSIALSIVYAI